MDEFDPEHISRDTLNKLADHLESFLKLITEIRVAPPEIEKTYGKRIIEGDKRTRKLIKKMRKGETESIFKEID